MYFYVNRKQAPLTTLNKVLCGNASKSEISQTQVYLDRVRAIMRHLDNW